MRIILDLDSQDCFMLACYLNGTAMEMELPEKQRYIDNVATLVDNMDEEHKSAFDKLKTMLAIPGTFEALKEEFDGFTVAASKRIIIPKN